MRLSVEEQHTVGDAIQTRQVVRDQNHCDTEAVAQRANELVEAV
jgi:hypothetical protein